MIFTAKMVKVGLSPPLPKAKGTKHAFLNVNCLPSIGRFMAEIGQKRVLFRSCPVGKCKKIESMYFSFFYIDDSRYSTITPGTYKLIVGADLLVHCSVSALAAPRHNQLSALYAE